MAAFYDQDLAWGPCDEWPILECATLVVPLDHAVPDGPSVEMALYRRPAARDSQGPIVLLPGGPGASGTDLLADRTSPFQELGFDHDLVSYDARATGATLPITCGTDEASAGSDALGGTVEEFLEAWESVAADCAQTAGDALGLVGTRELVRDLDVLRAALDEDALTLYGMSYGSLVGSEYARAFPANVARLVLDAPVPRSRYGTADDAGPLAARAEATFDDALGECFANPFLDCPLGPTPEAARERVEALLADLETEPVDLGARGTVTRAGATSTVYYALYDGPAGWTRLVAALGRAVNGQWEDLAALDATLTDWLASPLSPSLIGCVDVGPSTATGEEIDQLTADLGGRYPVFGEFFARGAGACWSWPVGPTLALSTEPVTIAGEVLVVASAGDPRIPPEHVEDMVDQMTGAHLLTYAGPEHVAYLWSDCARFAVNEFLVHGTVPEFDVCPAR